MLNCQLPYSPHRSASSIRYGRSLRDHRSFQCKTESPPAHPHKGVRTFKTEANPKNKQVVRLRSHISSEFEKLKSFRNNLSKL